MNTVAAFLSSAKEKTKRSDALKPLQAVEAARAGAEDGLRAALGWPLHELPGRAGPGGLVRPGGLPAAGRSTRAVILSSQIDKDILLRYRAEKWSIITGVMGAETTALTSTYDFAKEVVGYDLAAFFKRNQATLKNELDAALKNLTGSEAYGLL